jgi:hypothetical protein
MGKGAILLLTLEMGQPRKKNGEQALQPRSSITQGFPGFWIVFKHGVIGLENP